MQEDRLWSIKDLSDYLGGISLASIYQWRYRGEGPTALKVGRHLRYRKVDVDAWLEQQAEDSA